VKKNNNNNKKNNTLNKEIKTISSDGQQLKYSNFKGKIAADCRFVYLT